MRKVLIVDDESEAREFTRMILEPLGWEVIEADGGAAAIQKAKDFRPDLVILDISMPVKSGLDVLSALSKDPDTKNIKVIMLTGIGKEAGIVFSPRDLRELVGKEPDAYVEKPVDANSLKRIVEKMFS